MNLAATINARLAAELGPGATMADVARCLGETPARWRRYVHGEQSPTVGKVEGWHATWEAGRTSDRRRMHLLLSEYGWTVSMWDWHG